MEAGGGRTAVRGVSARAVFNANTGAHTIQSSRSLSPLEVIVDDLLKETGKPFRRIELKGNLLQISQRFSKLAGVHTLIEAVYFGLPFLLNLEFADPPVISHVNGKVANTEFRWELADWEMQLRTTTQEEQEGAFARAWERITAFDEGPQDRRLAAATHYFYVACRLARQAGTPGEFLAEVLLNLAKILEVLFPSSKDVGSIDSARQGLNALGLSQEIIEGSLLPALALRNHIDVGHVGLALFKIDQLKVLHAYTERAENAFRDLLVHIFKEKHAGRFKLQHYDETRPRRDALAIIDRMRKYTPDHFLGK